MEKEINAFIAYLHHIKSASENTELSYQRDLNKFRKYMEARGIAEMDQVNEEELSAYVAWLGERQLKSATISRNIASLKAFYQYLFQEKLVSENLGDKLRAPKVEKRLPDAITREEIESLFTQIPANTPKETRDRAMLGLLYATGIRVTELLTLKLEDVDLRNHSVICKNGTQVRRIPIDAETEEDLKRYLRGGRPILVRDAREKALFVNCSGGPMSRQGFWKMIKNYAQQAGIQSEITLQILRHSFAGPMAAGGAD